MGGEIKQVALPTREEVIARLIEIGRMATTAEVHTVWMVEDPGPLRTEFDQLCHAVPVGHLEKFPIAPLHLDLYHMAFYPYKFREEAVADTLSRMARHGLRCRFCHGAVHAASGCQYSETFIVCGTCIRPYQDVTGKLPKAGLPGWLEGWTASKSSKKLKARFPEAQGFYECAGKFKKEVSQ